MSKISDQTKRIYSDGMAERLKLLLGMFIRITQENEIGTTDLELLKESAKQLEDRISTHAAIGIMSPNNYELKQVDGKAKLARIKAIINLIEVFVDTQKDMEDVRTKALKDRDAMEFIDSIL